MTSLSGKKAPEVASLLVAPARLFYAETLPCPAGADTATVRALARGAIEATAPFPEDQLVVAAVRGRTQVIALGGLQRRLAETLPAGVDTAAHVVPDAVLTPPEITPGAWHWILTDGGITALRLGDDHAPLALRGFPAPPPEADDHARLARRDALAATLTDAPHAAPLWRFRHATVEPGGRLRLHWRRVGAPDDAPDHTATVAVATLDAADLRPAGRVAALRRDAATDARLRTAGRALAWLAALIAGLQAVGVGMSGLAALRESRLEADRDAADRVESRIALADTLDRVTSRRLPALEWLAAMNLSRPADITLARAAFADGAVTATGRAGSMGSLNVWLAALRADPAFATVETPVLRAAGDRVTFELRLAPRRAAPARP